MATCISSNQAHRCSWKYSFRIINVFAWSIVYLRRNFSVQSLCFKNRTRYVEMTNYWSLRNCKGEVDSEFFLSRKGEFVDVDLTANEVFLQFSMLRPSSILFFPLNQFSLRSVLCKLIQLQRRDVTQLEKNISLIWREKRSQTQPIDDK